MALDLEPWSSSRPTKPSAIDVERIVPERFIEGNFLRIQSGNWAGFPTSGSLKGVLNPTPPEFLTDSLGRPYFLWDCEMTLRDFKRGLESDDLELRAYLVGKLMRQAKPDDVFTFVSPGTIRELWPRIVRFLGKSREFWTWLFETWEAQGHVWR